MREIKFRYRYRQTYQGKEQIITRYYNLDEIALHAKPHEGEEVLSRDQYAELHDKNGKEIYEGDIVKTQFMGKWLISAVTWKDYAWTLKDGKGELHDMIVYDAFHGGGEVIGDKWENPELLEKK